MTTLDKLVSLAKRRGFVYPGSEIYGGLANTYDYGPLGAQLLKNIRSLWWQNFVEKRPDIVGLDASLISPSKVWEASGHTAGFADAMVDCKNCKSRFRADHVIEDYIQNLKSSSKSALVEALEGLLKVQLTEKQAKMVSETGKVEGLDTEQLQAIIEKHNLKCPNCGKQDWTDVRKFNLLFPVHLGIIEGDQSLAYLRGETAQGIFINFKNVVDSTRVKLPFGIAQLGKSFRNEITLGNSVFRTIEFEQGEIEYFFDPKDNNWEELFETWKKQMWGFITKTLGVDEKNLRWRTHTDEERSFYSKKTEDLEYNYPFGFKELWGLAYRTDYDLKQHVQYSGQDLSISDPQTNEKVVPHVIEPAVGINRIFLMLLCDAYCEENDRVVLKLDPKIAPFKAAVFPLLGNKPDLIKKAKSVHGELAQNNKLLPIAWDDRGNIGKRYLSQDEIGTPFCITIDFQTLEDETVTVRDRDTTKQDRVKIKNLQEQLISRLNS